MKRKLDDYNVYGIDMSTSKKLAKYADNKVSSSKYLLNERTKSILSQHKANSLNGQSLSLHKKMKKHQQQMMMNMRNHHHHHHNHHQMSNAKSSPPQQHEKSVNKDRQMSYGAGGGGGGGVSMMSKATDFSRGTFSIDSLIHGHKSLDPMKKLENNKENGATKTTSSLSLSSSSSLSSNSSSSSSSHSANNHNVKRVKTPPALENLPVLPPVVSHVPPPTPSNKQSNASVNKSMMMPPFGLDSQMAAMAAFLNPAAFNPSLLPFLSNPSGLLAQQQQQQQQPSTTSSTSQDALRNHLYRFHPYMSQLANFSASLAPNNVNQSSSSSSSSSSSTSSPNPSTTNSTTSSSSSSANFLLSANTNANNLKLFEKV